MLSYTSPNVDLDNKKRAFELLEAEELRHSGNIYYHAAHVDGLFDHESAALNWISKVTIDPTLKGPKYYPGFSHTMALTGGSKDTSMDVVHEFIHALDDRNGWHIQARQSEALAYSVEYILTSVGGGGNTLASFEHPQHGDVADVDAANSRWKMAWDNLVAAVIGSPAPYTRSNGLLTFTYNPKLTEGDVYDAEKKTGMWFSQSDLLEAYQTMLMRRGIAEPSKLHTNASVAWCFE